jgi:hypothetical protein
MFLHKGSHNLLFGLMLVFVSFNQQLPSHLFQSQSGQWSIPQTIPLYTLDSDPPILIADQNQTVHALSSQWRGGSRVIVYNQWVYERGWTSPTDIIFFPNGEARLTDAYLDESGILHVVFWGGDNTSANIYYSKAPVELADDAHAWTLPFQIGSNASDPANAVFAEDSQGTLFVAFTGLTFGSSIYIVESRDGGENWTDPTPLFFALADAPIISYLQMMTGKSGQLHAIWGVYTPTAQGRGVYYTQSSDGIEWSEPVRLAEAQDGLGLQKPTIFEYNDTFFLVYNKSLKIMMRRSSDQGATWDEPALGFPRHVGVNGDMALVVDSNNGLHLFFGQRITGTPDIHGMWHSLYVNNRWTEPEAIIKGPLIVDLIGNKGFDPNFARAAVSQGNVILLTWRTDPRSKGNGVWYSYKKVDAPELPAVPLPTAAGLFPSPVVGEPLSPGTTPVAATPLPASAETRLPIPIPTDRPVYQNQPALPIVVGSISALVLILAVGLASGIKRNRNK